MKLYHTTNKENLPSIQREGLKPNHIGIVYLSPNKEGFQTGIDDIVLAVETGNCRLTAFEDCKDWEVLCWGQILPENIAMAEKE